MNELKYLFNKDITSSFEAIPIPSSNTVIIYPPTINWDWMKQRPQQIMEQFALHGYQVYYCNMTQRKDRLYTQLAENLTIIHNNSYFVKESIPALKKAKKKILVWSSWSKLFPFLPLYEPDHIVYDYLDDMPQWVSYLNGMVEMADAVVTTAYELNKQIETNFPNKSSYFIPNGCTIDRFNSIKSPPIPKEFQGHSGPIILYSGAWANWVDIDLVEKIAYKYPEALIAIVGAEFNAVVNKEIPNICYIGHQSYENLPAYICNSTVCMIPFLINSITVAANPIKAYEYLAANKPVVSTNLPEVKEMPGIYTASSHEEFISNIGFILAGEIKFPANEVNEWLKEQTWHYRFGQIQKMLSRFQIEN